MYLVLIKNPNLQSLKGLGIQSDNSYTNVLTDNLGLLDILSMGAGFMETKKLIRGLEVLVPVLEHL